jgi:hypothetical protein
MSHEHSHPHNDHGHDGHTPGYNLHDTDSHELTDHAKLALLLPHLLKHNDEHSREIALWAGKAVPEVARELETVVALSTQISEHMRLAIEKLKKHSS